MDLSRCGGSGSGRRLRRSSEARKSRTRPPISWPMTKSGSRMSPTSTLASFAAPCSARSWRSVRASPSHMGSARDRVADRPRLEAVADRLDHEMLGALEVVFRPGDRLEDPAGEELLDRAVEDHRREVGVDVVTELAGTLRVGDDLRDQVVGPPDLGEMGPAEGVRRPGDL